jgi:glycyl-tRNA synthetase
MAKEKKAADETMDKIVSLCKRRGFIFPSSEIYGGIGSCWDYGPMGVELKNNIKQYWWKKMVYFRDNIVGLDASILMSPEVWIASGHVAGFVDPLIDCKSCKRRFKATDIKTKECPECGGELTEARMFNLMFKTHMGPVEEAANIVYLRPETAQGIYVNFLNVVNSSRQRVPFGIAQIGKAFRNEITPGNFIFRTREFEQMEMQFFVEPSTADEWMDKWRDERFDYYLGLGIDEKKLRLYEHQPGELAHYAKKAFDVQYEFPFGWQEIEGIHNRTNFDLTQHMKHSGKDLQYFDDKTNTRFIPHIIETSAGVDRSLLVTLVNGYKEEPENERTVLKLSPKIAPIKAAIFPLVKKDGMPDIAHKIEDNLKKHFKVFYDESGSVGRRYRRQDEVGTPYGITIDSETLQNNSVTLRERDSMEQTRVNIDNLLEELRKRIDL